MKLGAKFWLAVVAGSIALAVAGMLLVLLIDAAWYRWGFFGMFLFLSGALLLFGWIYDRRQVKKYNEIDEGVGA